MELAQGSNKEFNPLDTAINKTKENLYKNIWKKYLRFEGVEEGYETDEEFLEDHYFYNREGIKKLTKEEIDEMSLAEIIEQAKKYVTAQRDFQLSYAKSNEDEYEEMTREKIRLLNEDLNRLKESPEDNNTQIHMLEDQIKEKMDSISDHSALNYEIKESNQKYQNTRNQINEEIERVVKQNPELNDLRSLKFIGKEKAIPIDNQYDISRYLTAGKRRKTAKNGKKKKTQKNGKRKKKGKKSRRKRMK